MWDSHVIYPIKYDSGRLDNRTHHATDMTSELVAQSNILVDVCLNITCRNISKETWLMSNLYISPIPASCYNNTGEGRVGGGHQPSVALLHLHPPLSKSRFLSLPWDYMPKHQSRLGHEHCSSATGGQTYSIAEWLVDMPVKFAILCMETVVILSAEYSTGGRVFACAWLLHPAAGQSVLHWSTVAFKVLLELQDWAWKNELACCMF